MSERDPVLLLRLGKPFDWRYIEQIIGEECDISTEITAPPR